MKATTGIGDTEPEHITCMGTAFGGYCSRDTPARSLPADEHHLHRNATTFGSNSCVSSVAIAGSATLFHPSRPQLLTLPQ